MGEVVLQDQAFQARTYAWLAEAKPLFVNGLRSIEGLKIYEGAVNFLLIRSNYSTMELQTRLLRNHRIYIRDCMSFPELGDRFFRVAVRTVAENQKLVAALRVELAEMVELSGTDDESRFQIRNRLQALKFLNFCHIMLAITGRRKSLLPTNIIQSSGALRLLDIW